MVISDTTIENGGIEGRKAEGEKSSFVLVYALPDPNTKGTIPAWPRFESGYVSVLRTVCRPNNG